MSSASRNKRRRLRSWQARVRHWGQPDRQFGRWQVIDVHDVSPPINDGRECDFWCYNGRDVYLLRLRCSADKKLFILRDGHRNAICYLVAEVSFSVVHDGLLEELLAEYEAGGLPRRMNRAIRREL